MRQSWTPRFAWSLGVVIALATAGSARAETLACREIRRLPATLSTSGIYCLGRNLSTDVSTGDAITIAADDVVIDLNGRTLDGSAAGPGTEANGIGSVGHSNITIRNGTVRGFFSGIELVDVGSSRGHVIEGIRAERNTAAGISVSGRGLLVTQNQVLQTGGSTSPRGTRAYGIVVNAPASVVANNLVSGLTAAPASFVYGIHATRSDGLVIEDNRIANEALPLPYSFGIIVPFSKDVSVVDNRLANLQEGVTYSSGGTGPYRDNLTSGVTTPFVGTGTDAGNNH
jgi:hypothetical protein